MGYCIRRMLENISYMWWSTVLFFYMLIGRPQWSDWHWDKKGMRRALGGRWGLWEGKLWDEPVRFWFPSPCEHYPPPVLVNSTEPLETEDYTDGCDEADSLHHCDEGR